MPAVATYIAEKVRRFATAWSERPDASSRLLGEMWTLAAGAEETLGMCAAMELSATFAGFEGPSSESIAELEELCDKLVYMSYDIADAYGMVRFFCFRSLLVCAPVADIHTTMTSLTFMQRSFFAFLRSGLF